MGDLDDLVNENFLDTAKNKFMEHYPKLFGLAAGLATYEAMLQLGYITRGSDVFAYDPFLLFGPLISGYLTHSGANYYKKLRAYKKRFNLKDVKLSLKERLYTPKATGFRRGLDWILEHSWTGGLVLSAPFVLGTFNTLNACRMANMYPDLMSDLSSNCYFTAAIRALFIPLFFYLGSVSNRITSVVFHSENISVTTKSFQAGFYHVIGKKNKFRELMEELVKTSSHPSAHYTVASILSDEGSFDQAFLTYLRGLRFLNERGKLPYATPDQWLSLNDIPQRLSLVEKYEKELRKEPKPSTYIGLAFSHIRLNNPSGAITVLNDLSQKQKELSPHTGVLKVDILDGVDRKHEATQELRDLFSILRTAEYKKELIGETTRDVYVFGPSEFIKGSVLFKESNSLEELAFEASLVKSLEELVSGHEKYKLPVQVANIFDYEVEDGKKFVYTERFVPSHSLLQSFEQKDFSSLEHVVDYLALLHSSEELESASKRGRLKLALTMKGKLYNKELGCPRELARRFIHNYRPVFDSFKDSIYVFNKDAHPENWLIADDDSIFAIDFQDKGMVPIQFDLVNLMEYGNFLTYEQKLKVLNDYFDSYNNHKGEIVLKNRKEFELTYFNAVVQRAISLGSAWSSPNRTTLWPKREIVIENAINAIDIIKEKHYNYYTQYQENYDNLRQDLIGLKALVAVQGKA